MSNLVLIYLNKINNYDKMVAISNSLVKISLRHKKGIIFNFLGYDEILINQLDTNFYFSISDDFLQLNSNYCNVNDILDIESTMGKKKFKEKFAILDDVFVCLKKNNITNFSMLISEEFANKNEFKIITENDIIPSNVLYKYIVTRKQDSYSFGAIIINYIIKNDLN